VLLLERKDVNPNETNIQYGRTPLSWAAGNVYGMVTKLLLAHNNIDPGLADSKGRTPLSWAAQYGHEEVIKVLADKTETSPSTRDLSGRTPISWATEKWHGKTCISQLEESGFGPGLPGLNCSLGASSGNVDFVQYLLKHKDVNLNLVDKGRQNTSLVGSSKGKSAGSNSSSWRADVDPNLADIDGQTLLFRAIKTQSYVIV